MKTAFTFIFLIDILAGTHTLLPLLSEEAQSSPPGILPVGWEALLNGKDLSGWHAQDGKPLEWITAQDVSWDQVETSPRLLAAPAPGGIIVNGSRGRTANLITDRKFGDVELYLEFLIPKGSNSGVYLHGLYEVQIKDSYGVAKPSVHDCGAIYERWINGKGVGGSPPLQNVARPPGQWQSFTIWFRAPRIDAQGRKTENARFLRVLHNGVLIQRNVGAEGPTRAGMDIPEAPTNALMLQGDHGPVAFRNIYLRPLPRHEADREFSTTERAINPHESD